jgi:hypothetical protein
MVSRKIERAKYGPGIIEVIFGVVLSLLLGAVVAVVYLAMRPVQVGLPPPKTDPISPVTYIKGTENSDRAKQWLRKKQLFTEGSSVELNSDELNAWITAGMQPESPKSPASKTTASPVPATAAPAVPSAAAANSPKGAPAEPGAKGAPAAPAPSGPLLQFGPPNFRIANGVLQIGLEGELNVDMLGIVKHPIVLQASGKLDKIDGRFTFVPDRFYIGCCPLHKIPGAARFVFNRILASQKIPSDISAAWKKLYGVSIDGNSLALTMP